MPKLIRLFHTIRHLRLRQIAYQLYYRFYRRINKVAKPVDPAKMSLPGELQLPFSSSLAGQLAADGLYTEEADFSFLHQRKQFGRIDAIDWNFTAFGKLWTYNLNYFEYLRHPRIPYETGRQLIEAWIKKSASHKDGWEPYPTSLRIIHWLQFHREQQAEVTVGIFNSLRRQYQDLWRKREFHLNGNHLLENAIALHYGALFFGQQQEISRSAKFLSEQLEEQFLHDGAHYELSPMYHCILLWRLLDLYGFANAPSSPHTATTAWAESRDLLIIKTTLEKGLGWIDALSDQEGNYPHFNDSVAGIAPTVSDLLNYSNQLELSPTKILLSDSGYRHWRNEYFNLWIDAAAIGPDYIPGHAHADNLTFVLSYKGKKVIVDTAISTYEKNKRRTFERSTAAHNTVMISGNNSSDIWGGFRVGKRATTTVKSEVAYELTASHDGFEDIHQRSFSLSSNRLLIKDVIGQKRGTARLHLAAGQAPVLESNSIQLDGLRISFNGAESVRLNTYQQAMGFNHTLTAEVIEIDFSDQLTTLIEQI